MQQTGRFESRLRAECCAESTRRRIASASPRKLDWLLVCLQAGLQQRIQPGFAHQDLPHDRLKRSRSVGFSSRVRKRSLKKKLSTTIPLRLENAAALVISCPSRKECRRQCGTDRAGPRSLASVPAARWCPAIRAALVRAQMTRHGEVLGPCSGEWDSR